MNLETEILKLKQEVQTLRRELRGGIARTANPQGLPPVRLARISSVVEADESTDPTTHPVVMVYGIKFIDGTFDELSTVQTLDDNDRDDEEYFACAPNGGWVSDGQIVPAWWLNGRWWLFATPHLLLGKSDDGAITKGMSGVINIYSGATKGTETDTGFTVDAYARVGDIGAGKWCYCYWVNRGWEVIQTEC